MCVYVCACVCVHVFIYVCVYTCICTFAYVFMCCVEIVFPLEICSLLDVRHVQSGTYHRKGEAAVEAVE